MISRLSGRSHTVCTGVTVITAEETRTFHETTEVHFYPLSPQEVEWYCSLKEPYDKAGAYGIQAAGALLVQGLATSIDALSVGFTIAEYDWLMALVCSLIIAAVTLCICLGGLVLGRKFGMRLAGRAQILGGAILIFIGLEIFISSML